MERIREVEKKGLQLGVSILFGPWKRMSRKHGGKVTLKAWAVHFAGPRRALPESHHGKSPCVPEASAKTHFPWWGGLHDRLGAQNKMDTPS